MFDRITVCLDMAGCPNRCRHCWLGCTPNRRLHADDLRRVAAAFRPHTHNLDVASWYREPDYLPEYRMLWALENELSDRRTVSHWELLSVWRAVRDASYIPWLKTLGVRRCQLTLFGGEQMTDYYTGRPGACGEILATIDRLLACDIAPRIQVFVNKDNLKDLEAVADLIQSHRLEERCAAIGTPFAAFVHQGSCDGENARLAAIRTTSEDLARIPPLLTDYTLRHFGAASLEAVFGQTEQALFAELEADGSTASLVSEQPVFFVDKDFMVYPNRSAPAPHGCLGDLREDGADKILTRYRNSGSPAQQARIGIPLGDMVRACGDPSSQRLFTRSDYIDYILNAYCGR